MMALAMAVCGGMGLSATARAADTYTVDGVHSSVAFRVRHMNVAPFFGRFDQISGSFTLDEQDPAKSSFEITIPADSINTANPQRDQHLKSPTFFNSKQFQAIAFKSKKVTKEKDGYKVEGNLTLHGVTKPATVTDPRPEGRLPDRLRGAAGDQAERLRHGPDAEYARRRGAGHRGHRGDAQVIG
jgi:polyisoprenoid-binding protein YceI